LAYKIKQRVKILNQNRYMNGSIPYTKMTDKTIIEMAIFTIAIDL
jgi:hypothetical protein